MLRPASSTYIKKSYDGGILTPVKFRNAITAMHLIRILLPLLIAADASIYAATSINVTSPKEWWQTTTLYQIWPPSFKDSDGDGIGDLNGITSKLEHLVDLDVEVIWLSPFYPSPLVDSGYDISDYCDVHPDYGTLQDFDKLVSRAKELGLKVILDYVPNHTSDEHVWFNYSKAGIEPYTDYYIWNEGIIDENGTRRPPNNWLNAFNSGSAWKWVEERQAYYLHQFHEKQVDLNFTNPLVIQETKDILTFWLERGVDGFRIDSMPYLIEDASLADEPLSGLDNYTSTDYYYLDHTRTKDQPENYDIVKIWKDHIKNYTASQGDDVVRILFTEAYANITNIMEYYKHGSDVPFNFFLIKDENGINLVSLDAAKDVVEVINKWMAHMPEGATANWVLGNHDNSRVATRYGSDSVDALNFLLLLLPGVATIYNGDELGMTDTYISWEDTQDPQACSTDPQRYQLFSRDPERTPFQWDNTTSAGFSTNSTTMLPVNHNYIILNLEAQKNADVSHYKNVQAAIRLRKNPVIREGSLDVQVMNNQVVAFARRLDGHQPIVVLVNWEKSSVTINLDDAFSDLSDQFKVLIADVISGVAVGGVQDKTNVELPGKAAVVLEAIERSDVRQPSWNNSAECGQRGLVYRYGASSKTNVEIIV